MNTKCHILCSHVLNYMNTNYGNNSTTWCLKTPRCECCDEQGALCFSTCPNCEHIVLICDEVGTVFTNPKDLTQGIYARLMRPHIFVRLVEKSHLQSSETQQAMKYKNSVSHRMIMSRSICKIKIRAYLLN